MIRAANHSSFPKVGENPLDQQMRCIRRKQERGRASRDEVREVIDAVTTLCVAEQSRAFIDVVTDGLIAWEGPLSHLAQHLEGLEARELYRWFDCNLYDRRVEVVGEILRPEPFTLHDYRVAAGVSDKQELKSVLPGPVTFARSVRDRHYGSVERVAGALAGALAAEVADLAAAGARHFQIDEPLLCRFPADLELVAQTSERIFSAAGPDATTLVSTYWGDPFVLAEGLSRLPGSHIGLDLTAAGLQILRRLPAGKGVYLGLFDARTTRQEDASEVAARLQPYRDHLSGRDVLVGPNSGLELLPRDQAFDKLLHARYLVERLSQEWTWAS